MSVLQIRELEMAFSSCVADWVFLYMRQAEHGWIFVLLLILTVDLAP